jgi:uncharacterized protein YggE
MQHRWIPATVAGVAAAAIALAVVGNSGQAAPAPTVPAPAPAPGTPTPVRTITVSGEGKVTVKPDTANISLGVQATADTATAALDQANKSAAALIAALKQAGVNSDDIATGHLSLYPQYSNTNKISGYQASNSLNVKVRDIAKSGPVIDAAAKAAGDDITIGGIWFSVDDPEKVMAEARADAIANAKKRAGEFATAAGAKVGAVVQISEVGTQMPQPMYYEYAAADRAAGGSAAPTPVESGTQDLSVSVTVVYELS